MLLLVRVRLASGLGPEFVTLSLGERGIPLTALDSVGGALLCALQKRRLSPIPRL